NSDDGPFYGLYQVNLAPDGSIDVDNPFTALGQIRESTNGTPILNVSAMASNSGGELFIVGSTGEDLAPSTNVASMLPGGGIGTLLDLRDLAMSALDAATNTQTLYALDASTGLLEMYRIDRDSDGRISTLTGLGRILSGGVLTVLGIQSIEADPNDPAG